jgi:hypothetical protein
LHAYLLTDDKVSPKVETCGKYTEHGSDVGEHRRVQKVPSRAVEPIVWTKPQGMLDKKGNN